MLIGKKAAYYAQNYASIIRKGLIGSAGARGTILFEGVGTTGQGLHPWTPLTPLPPTESVCGSAAWQCCSCLRLLRVKPLGTVLNLHITHVVFKYCMLGFGCLWYCKKKIIYGKKIQWCNFCSAVPVGNGQIQVPTIMKQISGSCLL